MQKLNTWKLEQSEMISKLLGVKRYKARKMQTRSKVMMFFWDAWLNIKHIFSPRPTGSSIKVWIKSNTHLGSWYDPAFQTQKLKVISGEYKILMIIISTYFIWSLLMTSTTASVEEDGVIDGIRRLLAPVMVGSHWIEETGCP